MANGTASVKEVYESLNEFKDKTGADMTDVKTTLATIVANQEHRKENDETLRKELKDQSNRLQDLDSRVTRNTTICGIGLTIAVPLIVALIKADIV